MKQKNINRETERGMEIGWQTDKNREKEERRNKDAGLNGLTDTQ